MRSSDETSVAAAFFVFVFWTIAATMLCVASVAAAIVFFLWISGIAAGEAAAADIRCPDKNPCRILTLTPDEETALTGDKQILMTAEQGRFIDLTQAVRYFRDKIRAAPMGDSPQPPDSDAPVEKK